MFFDMKFKELERELNQKMNAVSPVTVNPTEDAFYEKAEQDIGDFTHMGTAPGESSMDRNCGNCANRVDGVCKVLTPMVLMVSDVAGLFFGRDVQATVRPPDDFVCVKWEPPK